MKIHVDAEHKNIKLVDSWFIEDRSMQKQILQELLDDYEWFRARSLRSYLREWRAHNRLYQLGLFKERTKDTDLNVNEYWYRRLGYFFLGW